MTCDIANEFDIRCRPIKVLKIYSIHLFIIQVYIPVVRNLTGVVQVRLFAGVYYASPVSLRYFASLWVTIAAKVSASERPRRDDSCCRHGAVNRLQRKYNTHFGNYFEFVIFLLFTRSVPG